MHPGLIFLAFWSHGDLHIEARSVPIAFCNNPEAKFIAQVIQKQHPEYEPWDGEYLCRETDREEPV